MISSISEIATDKPTVKAVLANQVFQDKRIDQLIERQDKYEEFNNKRHEEFVVIVNAGFNNVKEAIIEQGKLNRSVTRVWSSFGFGAVTVAIKFIFDKFGDYFTRLFQ